MLALKIVFGVICGILALLVLFAAVIIVSSLFVDVNAIYSQDSSYYRFLLYASTFIAVIIMRIRVDTEGLNKLPEGGFLLVSNHRSKFDPILTWHVMRKHKLAFISKPSNFNVPVFGRIIRKCCFMPIDRENPLNAAKTINHAEKLISDGEASVAAYPEGTRNYEEGLLPFHNGLFRIAQKAEVPVVVMTVTGTEKIHKNFPLHGSRVKIRVLDVIPADEVRSARTNDLGDRVRAEMLNSIDN